MKTIGQYRLGFKIGNGNYSSCYLGVKDGKTYCLKKVQIDLDEHKKLYRIKNEIEALKRLIDVDKIIQIEEAFVVEREEEMIYFIVTEAMKTDLNDYLKSKFGKIIEKKAKRIFKQILFAVQFCHSRYIIHHDIKLENIVVDPKNLSIKLIDFGFSTICEDETQISSMTCLQGTPVYTPPEKFHHMVYDGRSSDAWSCGVLLFKMLSGVFPFNEPKIKKLGYSVCYDDPMISSYFDDHLCSLLDGLLCKNWKKRMKITDALQHEWFKC